MTQDLDGSGGMALHGSMPGHIATRAGHSPIAPEDLDLLRSIATERQVSSGTRLLAAGQVVDHVLVVETAEVQLRARLKRGRRVMHIVTEGGVIADIPLLLAAPMPFDAVVSRAGTVCELDRDALRHFLARSPTAALRWMRSIAVRLDDDRRRLLAITSCDLRGQVAFLLLQQATPHPGGRLAVRLSHGVMAELLGARRQSVSRAIADLRDAGWIDSAYRETVLLDVPALKAAAEPALPA